MGDMGDRLHELVGTLGLFGFDHVEEEMHRLTGRLEGFLGHPDTNGELDHAFVEGMVAHRSDHEGLPLDGTVQRHRRSGLMRLGLAYLYT